VSGGFRPQVYGLDDVILTHTLISHVDGHQGRYRYRHYDAIELARTCGLEEVWYLLVEGELPTATQAARFRAELAELHEIPPQVADLLPGLARLGERVDAIAWLRSALSLLASGLDWAPALELDRATLRGQVLRAAVTAPVFLTSLYRLRAGWRPVPPDPGLGLAANVLYMLTGTPPPQAHARALERYLMIAAEHGMAASTFAGRVILSTGADLGSALAGALGALSGPLHGGAPNRALEMLDDIGSADNIEPWVRARLAGGERVMGFGHRIYREADPRAMALRDIAAELDSRYLSLAQQVEERAQELLREAKPDRVIRTNVELYAALVMEAVGLPPPMFSATFAMARLVGWGAHLLEQHAGSRMIRPVTAFAGGPVRPVPSLHQRGGPDG
jgi:citrate synthase